MRHLGAALARPFWPVLAALAMAGAAAAPAIAQQGGDPVAGLYDGSRAEVAAMLELGEDGRYRYQLSYGTLDEWSAGTWQRQGEAVVLTSDPFVAPVFEVSDAGGGSGDLKVTLDLPDGYDPQYFALTMHRRDGTASFESMGRGSLVVPMGDNPVVTLRPVLPVMDLLGPSFAVPEGGAMLTIAFRPNDLGFVGFSGEALARNEQAFELVRHDVALRFRKVEARR